MPYKLVNLFWFLVALNGAAQIGWAANDLVTKDHCDIPAPDLRTISRSDQTACQTACAGMAECKAYVFISGWNRCQLKGKTKPQFEIKMYTGVVKMVDGKRTLDGAYDIDDSGKDYKSLPGTANKEVCTAACLADTKCQAMAFIDGYQSCFLKRNSGKRAEKIFYCGVKSGS